MGADISILLVVLAAGSAGAVVLLGAGAVLRRLPEPADAGEKVAYRDLPSPQFLAWTATVAAVTAGCAVVLVPLPLVPPWLVLATMGVLLAAIDLATTWLPRRPTHAAWALMAVAVLTSLLVGAGRDVVLGSAVGAACAAAIYALIWAISRGGLGFGDVRFAPLIGAATGAVSVTLLIWALVLGSLLGAAHGLLRLALRRAGPFPYAPAMLAGAYLALLLIKPG